VTVVAVECVLFGGRVAMKFLFKCASEYLGKMFVRRVAGVV